MATQVDRLADILERAHAVHAVVTEKTGGADPDWALFYAWWLINWSDFVEVLGRATPPTLSSLTVEVTLLDEAYRAARSETPWPRWYAGRLAGEAL